jgi:hypothetical protein
LRHGCVHLLFEIAEPVGRQQPGQQQQQQQQQHLWSALLQALGPEVTGARWAPDAKIHSPALPELC